MKLLLPVVSLLISAQVFSQTATRYETHISPAGLREKLNYIAGPETQGRESGTHGQRLAAAYIENNFKSAGLLPGTPGGYQMVFPLHVDTLLDVSFTVNKQKLARQADYSFNFNSLPTMYMDAREIVFAGYGLNDSSRNDYQGLDVKDKWVMVLEGSPARSSQLTPRQQAMQFQSKAVNARNNGARGLFVVSKAFPFVAPAQTAGGPYLKKRAASLPLLYISPAVAGSILQRKVDSIPDLQTVIPGTYKTNMELNVVKFTKRLPSTNVIGLLPGTDKPDEYVVVTAHYDHVGMEGGVIHPGADDDGSGTVSIMQIAEAFAQAKAEGRGPRRSMVFMAVSGEEMGLLGSEFYGDHPIFPLDKTTVNLNIDMIGRITPNYKGDSANYVYLIGDDRLSTELAPLSDSANRFVGLQLDRAFNGNDPQRFYERSDHYNFAKHGVPIIFYFNGVHADYHRPTDTIDKINFDLMSKRARLVFHTAWLMANKDEMLKRDLPLRPGSR
ncbi:M28 family peptidase [Aridibaculum aurantiacum]|uniref:M28 family peptidase n=1 Tax=Aridibaculum aurantiacum TaxID=2810307 RepID=UPI001A956B42|nr:M28 family peptidase [Aridibaculum aurantiacum]